MFFRALKRQTALLTNVKRLSEFSSISSRSSMNEAKLEKSKKRLRINLNTLRWEKEKIEKHQIGQETRNKRLAACRKNITKVTNLIETAEARHLKGHIRGNIKKSQREINALDISFKMPPNLPEQEVLQRYQAHQENRDQTLAYYDEQTSNLIQELETLQKTELENPKVGGEQKSNKMKR